MSSISRYNNIEQFFYNNNSLSSSTETETDPESTLSLPKVILKHPSHSEEGAGALALNPTCAPKSRLNIAELAK